jgi:hypothetical protein
MLPVSLVKCLLLLFHILSPALSLIFCLLGDSLGLPPSLLGLKFVVT